MVRVNISLSQELKSSSKLSVHVSPINENNYEIKWYGCGDTIIFDLCVGVYSVKIYKHTDDNKELLSEEGLTIPYSSSQFYFNYKKTKDGFALVNEYHYD